LTQYHAAGCDRFAAVEAGNLAEVEFLAGDVELALRLQHEAVESYRVNHVWATLAVGLCNCAAYSIALARFEEARNYGREAVAVAHQSGFDLYLGYALQHLAAIAALNGRGADDPKRVQRAACVFGFVNTRFAERDYVREYSEQQVYDKMLPVLRNELGTDLDELMWEGAQWSEDRAIAEALKIEALDTLRPSTSSG
jgi:tetratricopeptide (TPR) repeat protein